MQFTESEIQEILRENQILKQDLNDSKEELEATGRLYDTMVVGTRNLLILIDEGQHDPRFEWGEWIRYTPAEVAEILRKHADEL